MVHLFQNGDIFYFTHCDLRRAKHNFSPSLSAFIHSPFSLSSLIPHVSVFTVPYLSLSLFLVPCLFCLPVPISVFPVPHLSVPSLCLPYPYLSVPSLPLSLSCPPFLFPVPYISFSSLSPISERGSCPQNGPNLSHRIGDKIYTYSSFYLRACFKHCVETFI